ncbi:MAG TPA: YdbL family protein [Rhodocyclaceae bacterium]|nr:YdbL family protein [Rhodocyclaceae bacterium]
MRFLLLLLALLTAFAARAQSNLDISTPAIEQLKHSMAARFPQLKPFLDAGAVGLSRDGAVVLRDSDAVPLAERQAATNLVAAENIDRAGLYRELARANGNPAWEADIRATFGQRWIERAPKGWWVQNATGSWQQKQ